MGLYPVFAFYEDKPRFEKKKDFTNLLNFEIFKASFFFFYSKCLEVILNSLR